MSLVIKAADFAARKHSTQRRKDAAQTPYVIHPIGKSVFYVEIQKNFPKKALFIKKGSYDKIKN